MIGILASVDMAIPDIETYTMEGRHDLVKSGAPAKRMRKHARLNQAGAGYDKCPGTAETLDGATRESEEHIHKSYEGPFHKVLSGRNTEHRTLERCLLLLQKIPKDAIKRIKNEE